jgi:hypothetical protein
MSTAPFFHDESRSVQFLVDIDGKPFSARVGKETLHYRYTVGKPDADPIETYRQHSGEIDAAVRRRVLAGSLEPVILRAPDLIDALQS